LSGAEKVIYEIVPIDQISKWLPPWVADLDLLVGAKTMKQRPCNFPAPKRPSSNIVKKKPAAYKIPYVPYVRHGTQTHKSRPDRLVLKRDIFELRGATEKQIIDMLTEDKHIPDWSKHKCPFCLKGKVRKLKKYKKYGWRYRCTHNKCQRYIHPHEFHPIYHCGRRSSSLQHQASALFALQCNVGQASYRQLSKENHKMIEKIAKANDQTRKAYVLKKEKTIKLGNRVEWMDGEADEVDLAKNLDPDDPYSSEPVVWEQWGGLVMRGFPETLILKRLQPKKTKRRAPGPGPIRKRDWRPIAKKHVENRMIVLHTDGARSYKLKLQGVIHDQAIHKTKKVFVRGKAKIIKPKYSEIKCHSLADGSKLYVKTGTQIIDRFWQRVRAHLKHRAKKVGSSILHARIRSAQFDYWYKGRDMWLQTGEMLEYLRTA
jgi:hypothetical protein